MSKTLAKGNYVLAKVNGTKMVLTAKELQKCINNGLDVEVLTPT
jgi:hypothetical protein